MDSERNQTESEEQADEPITEAGDNRFKADRDEAREPGTATVTPGVAEEAKLRGQLAALPGWQLVREGRVLQRRYQMPHFRAALAYASFVGEVAQDGPVEPEIVLGLDTVQVRLIAREGQLVGEAHLSLASALDFVDR